LLVKPVHFKSPAEFRAWLEAHHATATELLIGFYKKDSGRGGITYAEALDQALCFGWIDGVRKGLDDQSYTIRFTPRKRGSIWSNINVRHVERLTAAGRMRAAGQAAFAARDAKKTGIYSFERPPQKLTPELEKIFRAKKRAWTFWSAQPPGYQRTLTAWVIRAKQEETKQRRLATLIAESAAGRRIDFMKMPSTRAKLGR
jgi:uncharacterized protein YdeI (YjbR/CyaY-like superfamily)